jgi:hypothetical protein
MRLGLLCPPSRETSLRMQFHACLWSFVKSQFQQWTGLNCKPTSVSLFNIMVLYQFVCFLAHLYFISEPCEGHMVFLVVYCPCSSPFRYVCI